MTEIARAAGVCQATVSLALRKHPSIPVGTRERIEETARRLGYRQHSAISTLMAGIRARRPKLRRASLGAITAWPRQHGWRESATGAEEFLGARRRARELGFVLEEFWTNAPGTTPASLEASLHSHEIEGIVVFPLPGPGSLSLKWESFAAAAIGYTLEHPSLHRVATAHYEAVIIALHELQERGYRRVGLALEIEVNELIARKWLAAFSVFQFETAPCSPGAVALLRETDAPGFAEWVRAYKPDAVIFGGNLPVKRWLQALALHVPGDIGLVTLSAERKHRSIAGIDEHSRLVGAAAIDLVVEQLHRSERGVPVDVHEVFITGEWLEGRSVRRRPVRADSSNSR